MTAKRFEKAKFGTVIKDNSKQDTLWTSTECINRLNELAEENEQLKSDIERINNARLSYKQDWKYAVTRCELLEEENDWLKQQLELEK